MVGPDAERTALQTAWEKKHHLWIQEQTAKLEANDLKPAAAADRRTLIRRVYFDLIGLPPAPDEVERFLQDTSPDAWAKVVDHLLAS